MGKKLCVLAALLLIMLSACARPLCGTEEGPQSLSGEESGVSGDMDAGQKPDGDGEILPEPAPEGEEPDGDTRPRTFYRYTVEDVVWEYDAAEFLPEWLEAGKAAAEAESEYYDAVFSRGCQYDLDGDGRMEGILLFQVLEGDSHLWGNSLFIYINNHKETQVLTMGQDTEREDWRKMEVQLLHYQGFSHVFVRSGANNMSSGSFGMIYREKDGAMEQLFLDSWFSFDFEDGGVFFETQGPQGQGPMHYFWDELEDRYSAVGGREISFEEFAAVFDADETVVEVQYDSHIEELEKAPPSEYTADMFKSIEVYGNRYYQLFYQEPQPLYFTVWERTGERKWRYVSIGTGPMRRGDRNGTVYGIDMFRAEEEAV